MMNYQIKERKDGSWVLSEYNKNYMIKLNVLDSLERMVNYVEPKYVEDTDSIIVYDVDNNILFQDNVPKFEDDSEVSIKNTYP